MELSLDERRSWIGVDNPKISISRQCDLLGVSRSSFYYKAKSSDEYNLELMRLLDEQYMQTPFYGVRRMTALLRSKGHKVNRKRIHRLMIRMGIEAIYPQRSFSNSNIRHKKYPYLLRGLSLYRANHVWSTDITYIPMKRGFIYLVAVMDWFSRYVLSWELSNTQDVAFCLSALEKALTKGKPEIFNSDQGVQFTSEKFTDRLKSESIKISMDGRGRVLDNIFIERLWRSLKYEEVYLRNYENVKEAIYGINEYFEFYNQDRLHQSLGYRTPSKVHFGGYEEVEPCCIC